MGITHDERTERQAIVSWRRRQLLEAGFSAPLAVAVASEAAYDVHALIELTERGCAPELAARILAPLDGDAACVR
jgi:hypothetical protein